MKPGNISLKWGWLLVATLVILCVLASSGLLPAGVARAEGSRDLYRSGATGFRANLEWRTSFYGPPTGSSAGFLLRRTFLQVYADAGEVILVGSSAVGVGDGDVVLYRSDQVGVPPIGDETVPPSGDELFSCEAQRAESGDPDQGRITSRDQELAGPQAVTGGGNPAGYVPCYYEVPAEDIYYVAFYGPQGSASDEENFPSGRIDLITRNPLDFGPGQNTSVSAWDVTVRDSLTSTEDITGRLFADYLAMNTGGSDRPVYSTIYALTTDAYIYEVYLRGLDPYGFVLYANKRGFLDSDAGTPLWHDLLAAPAPPGEEDPEQYMNLLKRLEGGVFFAKPRHKIFFNEPSREARAAVNGGLVDPISPRIDQFVFKGIEGNRTDPGVGGTFVLDVRFSGYYLLVISLDGVDFDPDNPANVTFKGLALAGSQSIVWDGLDNSGNEFGEAGNSYTARIQLRAGEVHFPLLDVENSLEGGPQYELTNPPDDCPPLAGGCFAGFYDDRGYTTLGGTDVGTPGEVLPCPVQNPTGCNPPPERRSDPLVGFDTRTDQRAFGDGSESGFGDKKGLDLWTFYLTKQDTRVDIVATPTPPTPILTDTPPRTEVPTPEEEDPTPTPGITFTPEPPWVAPTATLWTTWTPIPPTLPVVLLPETGDSPASSPVCWLWLPLLLLAGCVCDSLSDELRGKLLQAIVAGA